MFTESPGQSLGLHLSAQFSKPFPHVFDKPSEHHSLGLPCFVPSAQGVEQRSRYLRNNWIPQFQDQLEWHYPSFYSNKCSTEAVWSFPVVSKLPVCTLQSSWAGPASSPFSRSLVSTCWPWPSWQGAPRRAWRCSLLLMCWEMKCRICAVPCTAVASGKLDTMEQVGHGGACSGSAALSVACSGCTVCIIIYFQPSLAKRQLWAHQREERSKFGLFWLPCAEMGSSGITALICSPWRMALCLVFYPICFGVLLF